MSRLLNKVAVVTASTEGIGFSIAKRLCEDGAKVMVSSRGKEKVDNALSKLDSFVQTGSCLGMPCHVGKQTDRINLIEETVKKFGKIDILVSNATVNPAFGRILDITEEQIDKILNINIKSAFMLVKEAYPHLNKNSSIVFVSSIAAFHPMPMIGAYSMSKTALLGLTKALAAELGPQGIRVNCIAPGIIDTKFSSAITSNEEMMSRAIEQTSLKRIGQPEDCAPAVAFLCSDDATYINGEALIISGGMPSRL